MDKYIIVRTFCDKEEIATKIIDTLLEKRLVAGSQIEKIHSKYRWENKLEECDEYKIEFRTKASLFNEIEKEIKKFHNYNVAEISAIEITYASKEFVKWIEENVVEVGEVNNDK